MYCHLTILLQGQSRHFFIKNVGLLSSDNDLICHYFFKIIIPLKECKYIFQLIITFLNFVLDNCMTLYEILK